MPGETHSRGRGDTDMDAWILGTGVPSLASALYLITEAKVPPNRVHMLEAVSKADGSTVNGGDAENGYQYRGGMMFPLTDVHIANLLSMIPSEHEAGKTLVDDILESSGMGTGARAVKGLPRTRFLVEKGNGISCVGPKHVSLGLRDHVDMFRFAAKSERSLGRSTVQDHFHNGFFRSNYWLVFATTLGFQPSHSAVEFHRVANHFMHNIDDLNTTHPLDRGRYNRHENMTAPIARFLVSRGVDFRFSTTVTDIIMDPPDTCHRVTAIKYENTSTPQKPTPGTITLAPNDITIACLGSIVSSEAIGTNSTPPELEIMEPKKDQDENWLLWLELCTKNRKFGNAYNFCTRLCTSRLESFTVTLKSTRFFDAFVGLTGDQPGDAPLVTLKDSSWLVSVCLPAQPLFRDQPDDVQVFWGVAMHPENVGDYVQKPMLECSGQEIMTELLHHLRFPVQEILEDSITVPTVFPRLTATLLPRTAEDRPQVVPQDMANLALIGRFVEIPDEPASTTGFGVKSAYTAVQRLMELAGNHGKH